MSKRTLSIAVVLAALVPNASAFAQQSVTIVAYSGLFQERYTRAVIEPFEKANPGIRVSYFGLPTSGAMLGTIRAQKASPQSDVAILDVTVSKAGTDEGLFEMLNETMIPNVADLYPAARFAGVGGVGVTFDNFDLIYNSELVKTPPTSLKDMASPAFKGKVAFTGMPDIIGLSAIAVMDQAASGPGIGGKFEKGVEGMMAVAPNIQTWDPQPEVYPVIINGQASIGLGWNARAQLNSQLSGGKLKAVIPSEGTVFQVNTINLVKGGPGNEAAKKFINYALAPDTQKRFTEDMFYAPTNSKAQIAPEAASKTAVTQMDKVVPLDWLAMAKVRDPMMDLWRRRILPLSR